MIYFENRFIKTITYPNGSVSGLSKSHYMTVSKEEIKKWERKNQEEDDKKIKFGKYDEKDFYVEIIEGDTIIMNRVKITDTKSKKVYVYPLDNNINEITIGENTFTIGRNFDYNEE